MKPLFPQRWRRLHGDLLSGRKWWRTPGIRQDMIHVTRTMHRVETAEANLRSVHATERGKVDAARGAFAVATHRLTDLLPHPEEIIGMSSADLRRMTVRGRLVA
jgi:hypothetical protein